MRNLIVRRGLVAGILLLSPVLAACSDDHGSSSGSVSTVAGAPGSSYNGADVSFVQGMIPHHEQAIEMAEIALDPSSAASARTKELAQKIRGAQDPEVQQMRGLLKTWGKAEMGDMNHTDHGMLDAKEMTALDALNGAALDKKFAELMIRHHEGAISQSEKVKADGVNTEVKALADAIITAQKAEITELKPLAA